MVTVRKEARRVEAFEATDGKLFTSYSDAIEHSCKLRFLEMFPDKFLIDGDMDKDEVWDWIRENIHELNDDVINPLSNSYDRENEIGPD